MYLIFVSTKFWILLQWRRDFLVTLYHHVGEYKNFQFWLGLHRLWNYLILINSLQVGLWRGVWNRIHLFIIRKYFNWFIFQLEKFSDVLKIISQLEYKKQRTTTLCVFFIRSLIRSWIWYTWRYGSWSRLVLRTLCREVDSHSLYMDVDYTCPLL